MVGMSTPRPPDDVPVRERLIAAAVAVLATDGPGELKVRRVSEQAGSTTISVYHHFGDMRGLLDEVVARGYDTLKAAMLEAENVHADPGAQLFAMALSARDMALANPHLYDLMFGLSTRGGIRAAPPKEGGAARRHFTEAYAVLVRSCGRLVDTGRTEGYTGTQIAAQLWSMVHGFISLEAAGQYDDLTDTVTELLAPMAITHFIGMGDTRERATISASIAHHGWTERARM